MAAQYLLPCECGSKTTIDTSQAGNSVECTCGRRIEVPSLRAIRELAPAGDVTSPRQQEWNPAAGIIFASGMLVALVGASVALYMHLNARHAANFDVPPEDQIEAWIAAIDDAPPEELFETWNASRHLGLGDHRASPFVQRRMIARRFATYRNTGLIIMATGLAFAGTSLLVRRKSA